MVTKECFFLARGKKGCSQGLQCRNVKTLNIQEICVTSNSWTSSWPIVILLITKLSVLSDSVNLCKEKVQENNGSFFRQGDLPGLLNLQRLMVCWTSLQLLLLVSYWQWSFRTPIFRQTFLPLSTSFHRYLYYWIDVSCSYIFIFSLLWYHPLS